MYQKGVTMYKFYKTDNKIIEREAVSKQLAKLESTDAKVEIQRINKDGKYIFSCKISDGKIVRIAEGNTPESACDNASDAFMRDLRKSKERKIDNAISRRRNNKQETKFGEENINNI